MILISSLSSQSLNLGGRRGTTDDAATIPFHPSLSSAALRESPNPIPVHSLMLSSHLFFCLLLLLAPFTVPCRIVFAMPEDLEMWPYHLSFRFFTMVRRWYYYDTIMRKWKIDYEFLYNNGNNNSNETDSQHLQYVKNSIRDTGNAVFPKPDCISFNNHITYEEVHKAVHQAKLRTASGMDNIHAEIFRNDGYIGLLFNVILLNTVEYLVIRQRAL